MDLGVSAVVPIPPVWLKCILEDICLLVFDGAFVFLLRVLVITAILLLFSTAPFNGVGNDASKADIWSCVSFDSLKSAASESWRTSLVFFMRLFLFTSGMSNFHSLKQSFLKWNAFGCVASARACLASVLLGFFLYQLYLD